MTTRTSLLDWSAFLPAIRESLQGAAGPVSAVQVRAGLSGKKKPTVVDVQSLLDDEVAAGSAVRWHPAKGKAPRYWTRSPESVARPSLLEAVGRVDEPLTADEYRKRTSVDAPAELVRTVLESLVAEGRCQRYEPIKGQAARYWAGDPDRYARRVMREVLSKGKGKDRGPLTWTELAKALKRPLQGFSEDRLSQILQDMLDAREAFKALQLSPGRGGTQYSTTPPDLVALLRGSLDELFRKFEKAGVARQDVERAAKAALGASAPAVPGDLAQAVLTTFAELKREQFGHSGLVPIPAVRRNIAAQFGVHAARHDVLDDVIKSLVKDGKLRIIPLDDATGISFEERNDAIPGMQETWFYLESRP